MWLINIWMQKRWKKNSKIYLPIKEQKNDLRPKSEQTHKPNGKIMKFKFFFWFNFCWPFALIPTPHITAATFKSNLFAIIIFHAISPRIPECVLASLCWWRIVSDFPQRSSNWFKSMLNRVDCLLLHFFIFFYFEPASMWYMHVRLHLSIKLNCKHREEISTYLMCAHALHKKYTFYFQPSAAVSVRVRANNANIQWYIEDGKKWKQWIQ